MKNDMRHFSHGDLENSSLQNIIDALIPIELPNYAKIFSDWKLIINKKLAEITIPYKIITEKNKNVLIIQSKKGFGIEVQHCIPEILQALNAYLKEDFFSYIKVAQIDDEEFLKRSAA